MDFEGRRLRADRDFYRYGQTVIAPANRKPKGVYGLLPPGLAPSGLAPSGLAPSGVGMSTDRQGTPTQTQAFKTGRKRKPANIKQARNVRQRAR
jgi:hypothetical protein